jgi:hypothetical protein
MGVGTPSWPSRPFPRAQDHQRNVMSLPVTVTVVVPYINPSSPWSCFLLCFATAAAELRCSPLPPLSRH